MKTTVGQAALFEPLAGAPEHIEAGPRVLITAGQASRVFGVSASAVSRWPLSFREARGRETMLDLAEVVRHRLGESGRLDLDQERARAARAQADRAELDLAVRAGELVLAADALRAFGAQITAAKGILRGRARTLTEEVARAGAVPRSRMTAVAQAIAKSDQTVLRELADPSAKVAADG